MIRKEIRVEEIHGLGAMKSLLKYVESSYCGSDMDLYFSFGIGVGGFLGTLSPLRYLSCLSFVKYVLYLVCLQLI